MAGPLGNMLNMNEDQMLDYVAAKYGVTDEEAQSLLASMAYAQNAQHGGAWTRTVLPPSDERSFVQWANKNQPGGGFLDSMTPGYDMRGYWKALMSDPTLAPKLAAHSTTGLTYPPDFDTPYSFGFSPRSRYWQP